MCIVISPCQFSEVTTKKYPPRQSIICCNYDPPILTFDSSDWTAITGSRGQHFAIGRDSFDKNCEYYTKNNSPADVFGALTFMEKLQRQPRQRRPARVTQAQQFRGLVEGETRGFGVQLHLFDHAE